MQQPYFCIHGICTAHAHNETNASMCWGIKLKNNDASATAAILTSHFILVLGTLIIDIFSNAALTHKEN
jgi:hypothetical protein